MLKTNHVWAGRGVLSLRVCVGMLATVAILTGCSSSLRPPTSPALMTPIEPTATMPVPATVATAPSAITSSATASSTTVAATPDEPAITPTSTPIPTPIATPESSSRPETGEYAVVVTSIEYVQAQVDVPVWDAPVEGATEISLIFDGQIALVTGASPDGAWWRIICSDDSVGDCWVSADPAMMLPTTPPQ